MKRFKLAPDGSRSLIDWNLTTVTDYGLSVVDKSAFRPSVNDVHNFSGGSDTVGLYDFPDGKDTGFRLGALRDLGADPTEISSTRDRLKNSVETEFSALKTDFESSERLAERFSKSVDTTPADGVN